MANLHQLAAVAAMAAVGLAGCGRPAEQAKAPAPAAKAAPVTVYACDDGRTVRASYPDPDTAVVEVDGRSRNLKIAISASGARYTGDGYQWWAKGMTQAQLSPLAAGEEIASAPGVNCKAPEAAVAPPPPGTPGGLPDDRTPVSEAPFTPQSAQGAANVVQTYYALIGEKKYAEAWNLWSDGGKASGVTRQAFTASFDKYASYNAQIGAPGDVEGAAGSLFVSVPVVIYGQMKTGAPVNLKGDVRLRRVNDVPGSTDEQRKWRIAETALKPSPGG
ncbi:MliC family protein [Phenylobacterium sp.]|uniref:MliC family protein n=1 Tax=Phenylobacterium sp. TaxID=1871053 RepID=UPI002899779C|nr:MliC family protein [Phenylobacterium sp.]